MDSSKRNRKRRISTETPEETAIRRKAACERVARCRERRRAMETPEQAIERRAITAEKTKKRRALKMQSLSAEEVANQRLKAAQQIQNYRERQRAMETPEQTTARLAREAAKSRHRRALLSFETPEQVQARRLKATQQVQRSRLKRRVMETPKQIAGKQLRAEQARHKLAARTPDKKNSRILQQAKRMKQFREAQTLQSECGSLHLYLLTAAQKAKGRISSTIPPIKQEDLDECCTWSSFGLSEGSFTTTSTIGENLSTSTDLFAPAQQNSAVKTLAEVKTVASPNSSVFFVASESDCMTQGIFEGNRDFESLPYKSEHLDCKSSRSNESERILSNNANVMRDEHLVYGEYIADSLNNCCRNMSEINFAKKLIDSIMHNLTMGAYSCTQLYGSDGSDQKEAPSLFASALTTLVVQPVIVKEEVDL